MGDNLMAAGLARGAAQRGKRIAFGDGQKIIWDHNSEQIFRGNPNIAPPESERDPNLEWIPFHRGNRLYNAHDRANDRWVWNYNFRPIPGEIFLTEEEKAFGRAGQGLVIIEPNVPEKSVGPNKQWPVTRYEKLARQLDKAGYKVGQFVYGRYRLGHARPIKAQNFRQAYAVLANASLYIGPEGGLHHAAAAVGIPAVVLFGGFIPPDVTGYPGHKNLTGGATACGSIKKCEHCIAAMQAIGTQEVHDAAASYLQGKATNRDVA